MHAASFRTADVGGRTLDRRRFLLASATGLALAGLEARPAGAATENDLAFANFGLATSYLVADFYAHALEAARVDPGSVVRYGRAGPRRAATHARSPSSSRVPATYPPRPRISRSSGRRRPSARRRASAGQESPC